MVVFLSLLIALIGAFMFALSANPKIAELGKIMFGAGLLAWLLLFSNHPVNILH